LLVGIANFLLDFEFGRRDPSCIILPCSQALGALATCKASARVKPIFDDLGYAIFVIYNVSIGLSREVL